MSQLVFVVSYYRIRNKSNNDLQRTFSFVHKKFPSRNGGCLFTAPIKKCAGFVGNIIRIRKVNKSQGSGCHKKEKYPEMFAFNKVHKLNYRFPRVYPWCYVIYALYLRKRWDKTTHSPTTKVMVLCVNYRRRKRDDALLR